MKIFIIGDPHLNHFNTIRYCNRPFVSAREMDNVLINNWNKVVSQEDIVYVNGDFCLAPKYKIKEYVSLLNGRKRLIIGNHDDYGIKTYTEAGFEMVSPHPIILEKNWIISHEPLEEIPENFYSVFAHVHINPSYPTITTNSFCTSVERIDYSPIEFRKIQQRIKNFNRE